VRFSEAVHNRYSNLYVACTPAFSKKKGLDMQGSARRRYPDVAAVLGDRPDLAIGDGGATWPISRRTAVRVRRGNVVSAPIFWRRDASPDHVDPRVQGLKIVTSPRPPTKYSVAKRCCQKAGPQSRRRCHHRAVKSGTDMRPMLAVSRYRHCLSPTWPRRTHVPGGWFRFLQAHRQFANTAHVAAFHDSEGPEMVPRW